MSNKEQNLYELWCKNARDDADLVAELESIAGNDEAICERFYQDLAFGTGGLRGVIGAGTARMNIYTVRRATQGFCNYLNADCKNPSVAASNPMYLPRLLPRFLLQMAFRYTFTAS